MRARMHAHTHTQTSSIMSTEGPGVNIPNPGSQMPGNPLPGKPLTQCITLVLHLTQIF